MPLTDGGRNHIARALLGESITHFNSGNARIGVGNGTAGFQAWHEQLQGQNSARRPMDSGFPTRDGNQLTFRATFGINDANFAWEEWAVFNAQTGGTMLNRAIESLGTKPNNQSWQFTVRLTVQNPQ